MSAVMSCNVTSEGPTPDRVALYARISEDDTGDGAGVERQLADARALAELRGWRVVDEFTDNSISAWSGRRRPGYAALMAEVTAGRIDRVVVWQSSRLLRDRLERAQAIALLQRQRVSITAVRGPDLDLSTAYGRAVAGIIGETDTLESEVKSERVARAAAQRAERGKANGPVAYGWRRERETNAAGKVVDFHDVIDEPAADVVREITRRLLSGESLLAVTRELNNRQVPPPGARLTFVGKSRAIDNPDGQRWSKTSVKKVALRPGNAGLRMVHKGRPTERLLPAEWPALVDESDWRRLVALLSAQERQVSRPASRQHLLTWGIGSCGVCGGHLRVSTRTAKKVRYYVCAAEGCVGRREDYVDELVGEVVVVRLSQPDALDWLAPDDRELAAATGRAQEARGLLATAGLKLATGEWTVETVDAVTAATRPKLEQAEADIRRLTATSDRGVLADIAGPVARQRWADGPLSLRRAILDALGLRVVILRTGGRGPGFDPESVRFEWRNT